MRIFLVLLVLMPPLVGCSRLLISSPSQLGGAEGAYYYLPVGKVPIKVTRQGKAGATCNIEVKDAIYEPDLSHVFSLKYIASQLSEDQVKVTLTPAGLLEKIEVTVEDKSSEIVTKVVEVAKAAVKAAFLFGTAPSGEETITVLDINVDPTKSLEDFGALQTDCGLKMSFAKVGQSRMLAETTATDEPGLFFRPVEPWEVTFKSTTNDAVRVKKTVVLPNDAPIMRLDIRRSAFVKKVSTITFEHGLLKSVAYQKPSEVVGFLEIPLKAVQALIAIPTELIQLKIDTTNREKAVFDAQKGQLDAMRQKLEAEAALRKKEEELQQERAKKP